MATKLFLALARMNARTHAKAPVAARRVQSTGRMSCRWIWTDARPKANSGTYGLQPLWCEVQGRQADLRLPRGMEQR